MNPATVYIIDDDPALVELLCEVVETLQLPVRGYQRATRFFSEIDELKLGSLLVLDLSMPEMDGIEVIRRLARLSHPPSLIIISGHDSGVLRSVEKLCLAHNLNILAALCKPIPLNTFRELLVTHSHSINPSRRATSKNQNDRFDQDELQRAIQNNELELHYQPQIEISSGKLIGVEALVRWNHPVQNLLYPNRFLGCTERTGLMQSLTNWVISQAVHQEQLWCEAGMPISVSVNISASDINSLTLPEYLSQLLENRQLEPHRLTLEITESRLMGKLATSLDILTRLRLKGIGLSIDDFGTGYSSLQQLHRAPFTELKIDRSFVSNINRDKEAKAIVKTCIMLGHELNMQVIAEGVENEQQLECLRDLGCDRAQGFYFGRPLPADKLSVAQFH